MDNILRQMLDKYETKTMAERKNGIKEIVQEIVLCGLSRAGFFKEAAFYGGTALRIFHGLDRFSEDLDFSLKSSNENFEFGKYINVLEKEVNSFGLNFRIVEKEKSVNSDIKSAFLKGNTKEHMLIFFGESGQDAIASNEVIKVKFEVDTNPPEYASYENKYKLLPLPYQITLYDMPSLFSGKIHAVLCRGWANRIKGRDLYDYVFYLSGMTPFNLKHLKARLVQTGHISENEELTLDDVKRMVRERFSSIDYDQAKQDVLPFIKRTNAIDLWSEDFFSKITETLKCKD